MVGTPASYSGGCKMFAALKKIKLIFHLHPVGFHYVLSSDNTVTRLTWLLH
jgi:hypothetical protein